MPDVRAFQPLEIPVPLIIWKNSGLGLECEPVDTQLASYFGVEHGVLVRSVEKGSAADKAGLRAGDVITAIGDHSVSRPRDIMMGAHRHPTKPTTVALTRDHRQMNVTITAPPPPAMADDQQ